MSKIDNNSVNSERKKILELLYPKDNDYKGKIIIAKKMKKEMNFCRYFDVGNSKSLSDFIFYENIDYYITANTSKNMERKNENLFSINNIVIDIDCHSSDYSSYEIEEVLKQFVFYVEKDLVKIKEIPKWNVEHWTGRGLHLWWHIEQASYKLRGWFDTVVNYIIEKLKGVIDEYSSLKMLNIDSGASKKVLGLFRMPFTYNSCTKQISYAKITETKVYKLKELYEKAKEPSETINNIIKNINNYTKKNCKKLSKKKDKNNYIALNHKRMNALKRIVADKIEKKGYRNNIMFLYYNAAIQVYDTETAIIEANQLNKSFKLPLNSIDYIINYFKEKEYLQFTVDTFSKILNLSEEEIKKYGLDTFKEQRENKRIEKENRNKEIRKFAKKGMSKTNIAKEIGCDRGTVADALKNFDVKNNRITKIQKSKKEGKSQRETAENLGISISTIKRYWNK